MTTVVNGQDLRPHLNQHFDYAELYLTPDLRLILHTSAQVSLLADLLRVAEMHLDRVKTAETVRLDQQAGREVNRASLTERKRWGSSTKNPYGDVA